MEAVLTEHADIQHITIYSDSKNTVDFCNNIPGLTHRSIRQKANAAAKLNIAHRVQQRTLRGGSLTMKHVQSHAQDKQRPDHTKRNAQNSQNFGERQREIEAGNEVADQNCTRATWQRVEVVPSREYDKFALSIDGLLIMGNTRREVRRSLYCTLILSWHQKQKKWSAFDRADVLAASLPNKNDHFANLLCQMVTGTVWTSSDTC